MSKRLWTKKDETDFEKAQGVLNDLVERGLLDDFYISSHPTPEQPEEKKTSMLDVLSARTESQQPEEELGTLVRDLTKVGGVSKSEATYRIGQLCNQARAEERERIKEVIKKRGEDIRPWEYIHALDDILASLNSKE